MAQRTRWLLVVLGDQLDRESVLFDGVDRDRDRVWMAEVVEEATHVPSSRVRTALFLTGMRHFARELEEERGLRMSYRALDDPDNAGTLAGELAAALEAFRPERVRVVLPGEWRVLQALRRTCAEAEVPLDVLEDGHFFTTPEDFAAHAKGRKMLRLEYFYRELRRRFGVLMDGDDPAGGEWNFDVSNRASFPKGGPPERPGGPNVAPDATTREVLDLVEARFPDAVGDLSTFRWPVTPAQAEEALEAFVRERLPRFGRWQDAMWTGEAWLYHSWLSTSLNLKLLSPRRVVARAERAWRAGEAPIEAVEGFIRQVLGWREYVRGIYWQGMPEYAEGNALEATEPLPAFYWSGETDMVCLRDALRATLDLGYAHHIQRLMVTGLYALLLGVRPREIHEWFLAVYADAVEWVELPNVIGMGQYADGGTMASKPYVASGRYIDRMGNACADCRYDPGERVGERACPFTVLYWDFLLRHRERLAGNPRMRLQLANADRLGEDEAEAIRRRARDLRATHRDGS
ncbi:MAG: cryptochrome/photolyase family protein [Deltaproteobacteria bacterium]|nr:MAG: cryptochrome/photolyase family protein [Deltaproteobacteria bacterium]